MPPSPWQEQQESTWLDRVGEKEGFVTVHGMDKRVFVKGVDMNRAIHRDIVAIRIFNQADWSNPSGIVEVDSGAQSLLASSGTARTQSGNIR